MVRFMLNRSIFISQTLSVLRAVNKANNPCCQGPVNDLRMNESRNPKIKPAKKRKIFQLLTLPTIHSQQIPALLELLYTTNDLRQDAFNIFDFRRRRIAAKRKTHQ